MGLDKVEGKASSINFHTAEQRLVDQVAVPRDTNEETALATRLP